LKYKIRYMRETLQLKPEEKLILLAADINPEIFIINKMDELIPLIKKKYLSSY